MPGSFFTATVLQNFQCDIHKITVLRQLPIPIYIQYLCYMVATNTGWNNQLHGLQYNNTMAGTTYRYIHTYNVLPGVLNLGFLIILLKS